MTQDKKAWYKSKTKIGALFIAVGPIIVTIGGLLNGTIELGSSLTALSMEIGAVLAIFGIRDLPFINKK